ncbi:MAG: hypothetical protein CME62_12285 [Halobacteriovoraceae bacterium]|nr:hypothetical protein [Halobacteriovoraceae bacterium]|tara:strand:- start:3132 stop:3866 length:735 start_codon:yes stop_codon:yes gene_type:complete
MNLTLTLVTILLSTQLFAQLPEINIQNLEGSYADPSGSARADSFRFDHINFGDNPQLSVEKQAGVLFLTTPEDEIQLDFLPHQINKLAQLEFQKTSIQTSGSSLNVSVASVNGSSREQNLNLEVLTLACSGGDETDLPQNIVLDSCLTQKAQATLNHFEAGDQEVRNLKIDIDQGELRFWANVLGKNIYGRGETFFDKENQVIKIRIDSVKWKFIKLTGRVFSELEKLENEKVTVQRPWITIEL